VSIFFRPMSAPTASPAISSSHYDDVATSYGAFFFYEEGPHKQWQLDRCLEYLQLAPAHHLVDIGGGTGDFTLSIARAAKLTHPPLVVEPSAGMAATAAAHAELRTEVCGMEGFVTQAGPLFDRVLLKEVVHHVPTADFKTIFSALRARLNPGARVLILTRPHEPDYPFFAAALDVWKATQCTAADLTGALEAAGFAHVTAEERSYECRIGVEAWLQLVKARFWSIFSPFTVEQLEEGCREILASHADKIRDHQFCFPEREVFVTATTP